MTKTVSHNGVITFKPAIMAGKIATKCLNNIICSFVKLTADDAGEYRQQAISTIICEGDAIGAVILCSREEREKMGETESKLVAAAAGFLGRQMEQ